PKASVESDLQTFGNPLTLKLSPQPRKLASNLDDTNLESAAFSFSWLLTPTGGHIEMPYR
ncbi:hypothetical protein, partial [uncultured Roseibium sp.]|uniref:hypothetical protein n=1 Tax=uncultured Roseibium sp. TaxID=1936171 RepID=UPI002608C299